MNVPRSFISPSFTSVPRWAAFYENIEIASGLRGLHDAEGELAARNLQVISVIAAMMKKHLGDRKWRIPKTLKQQPAAI